MDHGGKLLLNLSDIALETLPAKSHIGDVQTIEKYFGCQQKSARVDMVTLAIRNCIHSLTDEMDSNKRELRCQTWQRSSIHPA